MILIRSSFILALFVLLAACRESSSEHPVAADERPSDQKLAAAEPNSSLGSPELALTAAIDTNTSTADNSRCFVCHMNYQEEPLAVSHAKADVGCEKCHGASDDHCADEDNVTPPDMIFGKESVAKACMTCHDGKRPEYKKQFNEAKCKMGECLECHGEHRLPVRTRHWDPKTRQLLPQA